jgi:hypothetical protein
MAHRSVVLSMVCGVAVLAVGAVPASAATTLTLHGKQTKLKATKNGVVIHERYVDRKTGKVAGTLQLSITVESKTKASCAGTLKLAGGAIKLRCVDLNPSDNAKTKGVVVGGTGAYKGATGTFVDADTSETEDNLTIRLS